jgi:hypothetical protein
MTAELASAIGQALLLLDLVAVASLSDLGHEEYQRREHASAVLSTIAPCVPQWLYQCLGSPDPEVRQRARQILLAQETRVDDYLYSLAPASLGRLPWIDGHPDYYAKGLNRFLVRACSEYGWPIERKPAVTGWPEWRLATLYWLREEYDKGADLESLRKALEAMAQAEQRWLNAHQ